MNKLPDCFRGTELLFLADEIMADHPDITVIGFLRWLIDNEYEIRKFTTEESQAWPEDCSDYLIGKLPESVGGKA